jgi:hypothetical protein
VSFLYLKNGVDNKTCVKELLEILNEKMNVTLISCLKCSYYYHSHFAGEKFEVQRGEATCPKLLLRVFKVT